jgi:branched-chain amino acid transport system permease protein
MKRLLLVAVVIAALAGFPFVAERYYATLMVPIFGYCIAVLGLNLLLGYTGLLSFGHAMFVAIGGYTAAVFTFRLGIRHFEVILLAAIAIATLVAVPIGLLCVRYTKIFFGMLTLAFSMLFYSFLLKFYTITQGEEGIRMLRPYLLGQDMGGWEKISFLAGPMYYYCLGLLVVASYGMWRIVNSPFGLHLRAIRDNEEKASYLGVRVRLYRLGAFVIAAVYGAVGGIILTIPTSLADPELAYWTHSGNLIFMTLLGGFNNFFGPMVGALAFKFLQDQVMSLTQYWRFVMGLILGLVVILAPHGLLGLALRGWAKWRERRAASARRLGVAE